ncbi:flagellar FliJ family protein [Campylobacter sp. faydin G-105]|uniref:flagellar FliJ family protein n=1 Tax=Campylobacter anatolicus TaxID=2829105 RepID=UPI001B937521|nr:flagellar FliJ family protein [Campylobacter anatolicus]MBR8461652.1 flagellar FliJ family protein [Campylobacter anatolicus]
MKSKFSQVVRVKKQTLDRIEARLVSARAKVVNLELNAKALRAKLDEISMPQSGKMSELKQNLELLRIMRDELDDIKERLELSKKDVMHVEHQYKNANLDFEKIKYLEQEDFKREIKRQKHLEAVTLDEFAIMKFGIKGVISE